jgi:hypothetical protein
LQAAGTSQTRCWERDHEEVGKAFIPVTSPCHKATLKSASKIAPIPSHVFLNNPIGNNKDRTLQYTQPMRNRGGTRQCNCKCFGVSAGVGLGSSWEVTEPRDRVTGSRDFTSYGWPGCVCPSCNLRPGLSVRSLQQEIQVYPMGGSRIPRTPG